MSAIIFEDGRAAPGSKTAPSKLPVLTCIALIAGVSMGLWVALGRLIMVVAAQF